MSNGGMTPILSVAVAVAATAAPLPGPPVSSAATPVSSALAAPAIGRPAPDFALTTVDGNRVTLVAYRGKTLVVNVWGSWCPPCRLETADLVAESEAMKRRNVAFLGVDTTETEAVVRAYAAAKDVRYPLVATGERSAFARDYDITNYPTTVVIDPNGIVRAIHADNILPRAQLHAYVAAARVGASAPLVNAEQDKLDAMLAPARFTFAGDAPIVIANVRAAETAIGDADDEMDDAMIDPARDHDLLETRAEQNALRSAALTALEPLATTDGDRVLLARLRAERAMADGRFADAVTSYREMLALAPDDESALSGLSDALAEQGDDAAVLAVARRLAGREPTAAHLLALARANAALHDRAATLAAIAAAEPLVTGQPALALARFHLAAGRAALKAGDAGVARLQFAAAQTAADGIPRADPHSTWYLEQSQEAQIALGLTAASSGISVTIAPWTGPNLPGSIDSTYKYRVALSGASGDLVTVNASGLPARWIASFCTDRVCSPFRVRTRIPSSGVKVLELQIVPEGPDSATHPTVRVAAVAGTKKDAAALHVR